MPGLFVAFEGGEGAGKTTQVELLRERLQQHGNTVLALREPGGTAVGEYLRAWLKDGDRNLTVEAELFLFVAARAELVRTVVRPALATGTVVLIDRFEASTLVYQGYARGLPMPAVRKVNQLATGGLSPDLTILLDAAPELGLSRASRRGDGAEGTRFESADIAFHKRVRAGFKRLAKRDVSRWAIFDASQPAEALAEAVWSQVQSRLLSS